MKISILEQTFKRNNNQTYCIIVAGIRDNNGEIIPSSPAKFVGMAKCCPGDKYDFNIGKKLSLARAELKAFDYFDKKAIKLINTCEEIINESKELSDKAAKQYYHNIQYIKDIISKIK